MKKKLGIILTLGFFLSMFLISAGCDINIGGFPQAKYEKTVERQTDLGLGSKVVAKTSFGTVKVTGADVTKCSVIAEIRGMAPTEAEAMELAEQVEIVLEKVGNTLTVKADKPKTGGRRSIGISYEITVPRQTSLECSSSYGSVKFYDIEGSVYGRSSSGSISAENITGSTDLDTSYGSVTCKNLSEGDIKLRSSSGTIRITGAFFGICDAHTNYGSIKVDGTEVDSVKLHTSSGGISVACSDSTPSDLSASLVTSYGSIYFVGPQDYAGNVDISTSYGSIRTELPITVSGVVSKKKLRGTVGQGNGKLYLHTSSGSIQIK